MVRYAGLLIRLSGLGPPFDPLARAELVLNWKVWSRAERRMGFPVEVLAALARDKERKGI